MKNKESGEAPLVDTGLAPEIYVSGLGTAELVDREVARLTLYANQVEAGRHVRLVRVALIIPATAIGPALDLCVQQLGAGALLPQFRRLVM